MENLRGGIPAEFFLDLKRIIWVPFDCFYYLNATVETLTSKFQASPNKFRQKFDAKALA